MLVVDGISRSFGDRLVLDNVSFECANGTLTGFVGGNGAGKTTTMRIIMGVLAQNSGRVLLDDVELRAEHRRGFGYMPEERGLYPKMTVIDQLVYLARLQGFDKASAHSNAMDLIERLGIIERKDDKLETLSLGNQQRAQIAAAMVQDPVVLILDEPFSGLDPMAVDVVVGVLAEFAERGVPVLFSSHQLDVVERLCDNLVIIADGKIRAAGTRDELREQFSPKRFEIVASGDLSWIRDHDGLEVVELADGRALFDSEDPSVAQNVLRTALTSAEVTAFGPSRPSLGEIFREIIADAPESNENNVEVAR